MNMMNCWSTTKSAFLAGASKTKRLLFILTLLISVELTILGGSVPKYRIIDLGDLTGGENGSVATALNDMGQVVGYSSAAFGGTYQDEGYHAFLWTKSGGMYDLGELPGGYNMSRPTGVNNYGIVVGYSPAIMTTHFRAFQWDAISGMKDLGTIPAGYPYYAANALNDSGSIAAHNWSYWGSPGKAFLFKNGTWTDLGNVPGGANYVDPKAINNLDQIAGITVVGSSPHAFLWNPQTGQMQDLGFVPNGIASGALAINDNGLVAGYSWTSSDTHAFAWSGMRGMYELATLNPASSYDYAFGINNQGQIVGQSKTVSGQLHASMWLDENTIYDLNLLVEDMAGWNYVQLAYDINNLGQIVGFGYLTSGARHAFMLDPLPPSDQDEDGIPDDLDLFPNSDTRSTIFIGDVDTGIVNELLENGATLADLISAVIIFDSGNAEIVGVLVDLKALGLITGREMGKILSEINAFKN